MHPLIARIHPALRTALMAWLLSRSVVWLATPGRPSALSDGAPLPGLVTTAMQALEAAVPAGAPSALVAIAPWVVAEVLLLCAGVAVYRFTRTTDLPQLAERACWLWFFNPVLAMSALDWGTQVGAATGALAIAGIVTHRPRRAALAAVIAVGCRLEFILLWPAIALAAWSRYRPDKHSPSILALSGLTLPVAFSAWIGASWHLAGASHTSLRALHGDAMWRDAHNWMPSSAAETLLLVALATAIVLLARYARRFPLWYVFCALPALLWPFAQVPAHFAAVTAAWALPSFVHFALATDDRAVERPLLAALIIGFVFAAIHL